MQYVYANERVQNNQVSNREYKVELYRRDRIAFKRVRVIWSKNGKKKKKSEKRNARNTFVE